MVRHRYMAWSRMATIVYGHRVACTVMSGSASRGLYSLQHPCICPNHLVGLGVNFAVELQATAAIARRVLGLPWSQRGWSMKSLAGSPCRFKVRWALTRRRRDSTCEPMPTYEYVCEACGHQWEAFQSIKDDPLTACPTCEEPKAKRQISAGSGFILKGGGWYSDLYASSGGSSSSGGNSSSGGSSSSDGGGSSTSTSTSSSSSSSASSSTSDGGSSSSSSTSSSD